MNFETKIIIWQEMNFETKIIIYIFGKGSPNLTFHILNLNYA